MNIILIGGGKTTYFLARQFIDKGYHLSIINKCPSEAKHLSEQVQALVIKGDGSDPSILEEAGARRAEVVVALTPHDQDNLIACQLARQLYGVPRTLALVNDPENEAVFIQLGVSVAFSATQVIANLLEQKLGFDEILTLVPAAEGRASITEIILRPESPAIGRALQELDLPKDSLVAAIVRDEQVIIPRGNNLLHLADRLVLLTLPHSHNHTLRTLLGYEV